MHRWLLITGLLLASAPACADELIWPLPIAPALSSSFGESRSSAFHAGIDLKTWGRTGYEVRALGDGHIERLRTSPWGYGRAVYLRLTDGRVAVFAHLEAFASRFTERIHQAQSARGRYSVDLWFKEGELPVKRGDIIAYSGESGAGPPHLHLELRDKNNIPTNPLLKDYAIEDAIAPVIKRFGLVPFGVESRVNGRAKTASFALRWNDEKQAYTTKNKVQIHGRVGVNALVWDRADAAPNKLAPYALGLLVDGREVFRSTYDRVSYADAHQVQLDRMYIDYGGSRGRFNNLFRRPGNRLDFYRGNTDGLLRSAVGAGGGFLAGGEHNIEIVAEDILGNRSVARFVAVVNVAPSISAASLVEHGKGWKLEAQIKDADDALLDAEIFYLKNKEWRGLKSDRIAVTAVTQDWQLDKKSPLWKLVVRDGRGGIDSVVCALPGRAGAALARMKVERRPHLDWVELILTFEKALSRKPQVWSGRDSLVAQQIAHRQYAVLVPLRAQESDRATIVVQLGDRRRRLELMQIAVQPGEAQTVEIADGNVRLDFLAKSAYELFFPYAESFEPVVSQDLHIASAGYVLGPDIQFDARVGVKLRYDAKKWPLEKVGIYEEVGEKKWAWVGNEQDGEWVGTNLRNLGRFALLVDLVAPEIRSLRPKRGAKVQTRRPLLSARIEDLGSGIGREDDIAVELDGRALIVEYDPEAKEIRTRPDQDLKVGKREWVVRVRDMSGNEQVQRSSFRVVK